MKRWNALAAGMAVSVIVVAALACGGETERAKSGSIEGTVTDSEGSPLAGMRVSIARGTASFPDIAPETDENGFYRMSGISPGEFQVAVHDVQAIRIGLANAEVRSGETTSLNIVASVAPTLYPTGQAFPDFETCDGFWGDLPLTLAKETTIATEAAAKDDPSVVARCIVSIHTSDGADVMTLTASSFDSVSSADAHFDSIQESVEAQVPGGIGGILDYIAEKGLTLPARSFKAVSNDTSIGNSVVSRTKAYVVQFHTSLRDHETHPAGVPSEIVDHMVELALSLTERLP